MQEPLLVLGILLVSGVAMGWVARRLKVPTLTGQIAAGILLGPMGFAAFGGGHSGADGEHGGGVIDALGGPINDLAMALVLFVLGAQFRFDRLKRNGKPIFTVSAVESVLTFSLVTALSWLAIRSVPGAVMLGVMAMAVAPATTIVVLREYHAKGPATDAIKLLTALSNVWAVFVFEIVLLVFAALQGGEASPRAIAWDLTGSLFFGLVAGHLLILLQERTGRGNYSLPLLTVICLTIGICKLTEVPHMLTFLVTGTVVVNRSRYFDPISEAMDVFAKPAFVLFFVLSGLHLDFGVLRENWLAAGLYVLARTLGKIVGARLGMAVARWSPSGLGERGSPPLGLGLLCQAGAAIALATYVRERYDRELGETLLNVILGGVLVFELLGPLLVKRVALAAGEISLAELLAKGADRDPAGGTLRRTLGLVRRGRRARLPVDERPTVGRMMRATDAALAARASLDEVLKFANRSPFNQLPVVHDDGRLLGMIELAALDQVAYDRRTANLFVAADMATLGAEESALPADAEVERAMEFFRGFDGNTAAVVDPADGRLVGMLERAEVLRVARALHVD